MSRKIVYYNFDETTENLDDKDFFDAIDKIDIKSKASQEMNVKVINNSNNIFFIVLSF